MTHEELERVVALLRENLHAARLHTITDGDRRWLMEFYVHSQCAAFWPKRRVYLLLDTKNLRLHCTAQRFAAPQPQDFTMLLRKHLLGLFLRTVSQLPDDRVITFEFGNRSATFYRLILELTGRSSNIFLLDESNSILASETHQPNRPPHSNYAPPAPAPMRAPQDNRYASLCDYALLCAWDADQSSMDSNVRVQEKAHKLRCALQRVQKKTLRLQDELRIDLDKANAALKHREEADILAAHFAQLKKGMQSIRLPSFDGSTLIEIELLEALSPKENIEHKYKILRKMQRAIPILTERLLRATTQAHAIEGLLDKLNPETCPNDESCIDSIQNQALSLLPLLFGAKQREACPQNTKTQAKPLPYRAFFSKNNIPIWVGKSAKDNDLLTFQHAKSRDTWMHVVGATGSHVVIKSQNPDSDTLIDAACLAVHYSKLSKAGSGEVHSCPQHYVKRIKGAPPGKVSINNAKIIHVRVDQERLTRLMQSSQS